MGFWFFKGLDVRIFHGSRMFGLGFSDTRILRISLDVGHLAFRILIWVLLVFFGYWFFSELIGRWFFGSDRFRLLIQRWKNVTGRGNLFDQGEVWPDESGICPTNGSAD